MDRPVLVTGAAGRTGRAVIRALKAHGRSVRGLVHDPGKAVIVEGLGAQAVVADLDDAASLAGAARGCGSVVHIGPPMHPNEVAQTAAMLDAAKAADIGDFIYYSVMHPLRQEVDHHRRKLLAEALVIESGLAYTILQPCRYMQHLDPIWDRVVTAGEHAMPFSTEVRFAIVDLDDLAEAVAIVEGTPGHRYATYELAGPANLSQVDMAAIIAARLGREVRAIRIRPEQQAERMAAAGMSELRVGNALRMNRHYDAHGFLGNANVLRWLLGREPTTFAAYVDQLARSRTGQDGAR